MSRSDPLKLENQLCFPLYVCAKEVVNLYKPYLDEIGLTYTQFITLIALWEHKVINVKDLGKCLYLDSGTLTPLLKKMEEKGLVKRERSKTDERTVNVELTEKGKEIYLSADQVPNKVKCCLALNEEDADALYKILQKIIATFPKE